MESKNLILAVVLSVAVIFLFGVVVPSFMAKPKPEEKGAVEKKDAGGGGGETAQGAQAGQGAQQEPAAGKAPAGQAEAAPAAGAQGAGLPDYPVERHVLTNSLVRAVFSTQGAAIVGYGLLDPHYAAEGGKPLDLVTADPVSGRKLDLLSFRGESDDSPIPADLRYRLESGTDDVLVFVSRVGPWEVRRRFKLLADDYRIAASTVVTNLSDRTVTLKPFVAVAAYREQKHASGVMGWLNPSRDIPEGICAVGGELVKKPVEKLQEEKIYRAGAIGFAAADSLYFIAAVTPLGRKAAGGGGGGISGDEGAQFGCSVAADENQVIGAEVFRGVSKLSAGGASEVRGIAYIGPKEYTRLSAAGHELKDSIAYGWFGGLAIFFLEVLKVLFSWMGNWGLAIIVLTILIKVVLLPLTHWSYVSMRNMQAVKPLIDDINRKYAEDKDRKNQAMLELYKTHKINPTMGCLPMLLQMPIWIALYSMLARSVELYHTPFYLWIDDLSQRDPYFVLPLLLGASMFVQQKMTPTTMDSQQAKMMLYFMPVMFTVFMLFLPAGLNLYIFVSTLLTILQQKLMYKPKVETAGDRKVQLLSELDGKGRAGMKKKKKEDR